MSALVWSVGCSGNSAPANVSAEPATELQAPADAEAEVDADDGADSEAAESEEVTEADEASEEASPGAEAGMFEVGDCTDTSVDDIGLGPNRINKVDSDSPDAKSRVEQFVEDLQDCPEGLVGIDEFGPDNPNYCLGPL